MTELENRKIYNYIDNDKLKIEEIIKDYTNYIKKIIQNTDYVRLPKEDIEEIILDVFLAVWKNQNRLDINKNMSSYISGITKNLFIKKYKKYRIHESIDDYEEKCIDLTSEKQKILVEEFKKIKKEEDKEIFTMYYYEEKNIKEISKICNMSESKIKSKLFRVRRKLKKALKERGYSYE